MSKRLKLLIVMLVASFSMPLFATSIDSTTANRNYTFFTSILTAQFEEFEEGLEIYLGEKLGCRLVSLKFNKIAEPKLFRKDSFNLNLTAECNKTFDHFNLDLLHYGETNENGLSIDLKVSYILDGKEIEEVFSNYQKNE